MITSAHSAVCDKTCMCLNTVWTSKNGITKCRSIRLKVRSNNFKEVTRLCDEFRKIIEILLAEHDHLSTLCCVWQDMHVLNYCLDYQKWNYKTLRLMRMNVIVGARFCDEFNKSKQVKSYWESNSRAWSPQHTLFTLCVTKHSCA